MSKKRIITGTIGLLFVLLCILTYYLVVRDHYLTRNQAERIILDLLEADGAGDRIVAYLYPEMLKPGTVVRGWDQDETVLGEIESRTITERTWLAWIDREPENAFFGHPVEFVYINARNGIPERTENEFWPVIDNDSFEGGPETMIAGSEAERAFRFRFDQDNIRDLFLTSALAEGTREADKGQVMHDRERGGSYLHVGQIKEGETDEHDHYAFIISGYGKNSWVFLEGAHQLYSALTKKLNYDPKKIYFLGPGKVRLDPSWNREEPAKLLPSDIVNGSTDYGAIKGQLEWYAENLKKEDSLFIALLVHGKPGYLAVGQPVSGREKMGDYDIRKGATQLYQGRLFAEHSVGSLNICELMILFDSCYSGTEQKYIEPAWKKENIKRIAVAYSATDTRSYGANHKPLKVIGPGGEKQPAVDLDRNDKTDTDDDWPFNDPNPTDEGGEFSSGFIENIDLGLFKYIFDKAVTLDAARLNSMTDPYYRQAGESGSCLKENNDAQPEPPQDAPVPAPKEESPKETGQKTIQVVEYQGHYIPYEQLKPWSHDMCDCCQVKESHYHARNGEYVIATDGAKIPDPMSGCGYGTVMKLTPFALKVENK